MCGAEKRAEGLEYMHTKPKSHSGRIVDKPEVAPVGPIGNDKSACGTRLGDSRCQLSDYGLVSLMFVDRV